MPHDPVTTLEALGGSARTNRLRDAGVHPRELYAARDRGDLVQLARGLWTLPERNVPDPDLAAVCLRVPGVVFGVLTALVLHDLTDEIPRQLHVILPHGHHPPRIPGVPIVGYHVHPDRLTEGVELRRMGDGEFRVTDVPRTLVDLFKYRRRHGVVIARSALIEALRRRVTTPAAIAAAAEAAGVASVVGPVLEVVA
jgi:predicted transcriptional regulator of viral defense system